MRVCQRSVAASILALVCVVGLAGSLARAFIPKADRVAKGAAEANEAGDRAQALQLELTLRVGEREPIGTGKLITHPTGLARLELHDARQRVERHLLIGTEHTASRDGRELESPRPFLPPLFFLQVDSPQTFRQALSDYWLDPDAVALAPCGKRVCYVIGDPLRVPPPPPPTEEELAAEADAAGGLAGEYELAEPSPLEAEPQENGFQPDAAGSGATPGATLWLDVESYEIRRIASRSGVVVDFGPFVAFQAVRFPAQITISEPGREPVRFDIRAVTPVNAPAAGFGRAWLLSPDGVSPEAGYESGVPHDQSERDGTSPPPTFPERSPEGWR